MRSVILLSALSVLAACGNDGTATSPNSNRSIAPAAARADARPDQMAGGKPQAGPTITVVTSTSGVVAGVGNITGFPSTGSLAKACPAGTQVIGGGFTITSGPATDVHLNSSVPDGANGWKVNVTNTGNSSSYTYFTVTAVCIS